MGAYPICIFSPHPYKVVANEEFSRPRLRELAERLYRKVDVKRVFSVFAFAPVSQVFADEWQRLTGIAQQEVYYAAKQSYCTKASLRYRPLPQELKHSMRLAMDSDIPGVADLCYQFAQDSAPFVLTHERALDEAKYLVSNKKVWVHLGPGTSDTIASIVAVTREGGDVSSITKVFTGVDWRRMGCAKRLTAFVCEELLRERNAVVLYVGHDNPAKSVYSSIGFVGLGKDEDSIDGVDDWLELGFDRERVELGHCTTLNFIEPMLEVEELPPAHLESSGHRSLGQAELGDTLIQFGVDATGHATFRGGQRVALGLLTPCGSSDTISVDSNPSQGICDPGLTRHGTILSASAPAGRNAAELKCLLGNSSAKLRAGTLLLPQPGQSQVTGHDLTALEQAKPRARVEVDVITESDTYVEGGTITGRAIIKIRNRRQKESAIMIGGGKLRVIGFESVSNESTRHMFYQHAAQLSDISAGTEAMYGSRLDDEGFALAREGDYSLRFSMGLPLDGAFGQSKGTLVLNSALAVRYIIMISIKVKDICTGKRSIAHFYRHCSVWPRLNPSQILAPDPTPLCSSSSKGFLLGGSGKVELLASIHRTHWVAGQRCFVRICLINNTSKAIKRLGLSLVRSVVVFVPDPSLDTSKYHSNDIDPDACQTSTSQKQVAESSLEMGGIGSKGHASAKGWWTGVPAGERCTLMHSVLLPADALTILRSRLLEVTYEIWVVASAGPLTSDVRVKLPLRIVNFLSLDPPPCANLTTLTASRTDIPSIPHCTREPTQQDRIPASRIFDAGSDRLSHSVDGDIIEEGDDGQLARIPYDETEQQLYDNQVDDPDDNGLGNLAMQEDCNQVVQHAINSARVDSMYGENALRFSDLYTATSSREGVAEEELDRIEEDEETELDRCEDTVNINEEPVGSQANANETVDPPKGSLRFGPRPSRPRGPPSFTARVQEKIDAARLRGELRSSVAEHEEDEDIQLESEEASEIILEEEDNNPQAMMIQEDDDTPDLSTRLEDQQEPLQQMEVGVGGEAPIDTMIRGSRLLPIPPSLGLEQPTSGSVAPLSQSQQSDIHAQPPPRHQSDVCEEPSRDPLVNETNRGKTPQGDIHAQPLPRHQNEEPMKVAVDVKEHDPPTNHPLQNQRTKTPPPNSVRPPAEESPVKKRIREMEERMKAMQT
ncbi:hypothetical protein ONZ45_g187 [Pleurotus djamor]|nr:hypothetical protein ONZ45_g187 [Pleurotus djamor]